MTGKERWEPGWKVLSVRCDGKLLLSPYAPRPVEYAEGEITEPEFGCGPLTVFKHRNSAAAFERIAYGRKPVVMPCAYVKVPIPQEEYARPLWTLNTPRHSRPLVGDLPPGTRLAKAVMLLPRE